MEPRCYSYYKIFNHFQIQVIWLINYKHRPCAPVYLKHEIPIYACTLDYVLERGKTFQVLLKQILHPKTFLLTTITVKNLRNLLQKAIYLPNSL